MCTMWCAVLYIILCTGHFLTLFIPFLHLQISSVCELAIEEVVHGQKLGKLLNLPNTSRFSYKHLMLLMTPEFTDRSVHVPTFHEQK